uniref:Immunoglobulin domain-containing protein n=1 Tax=Gopherus agassizii TaxID=38772 RepID=A0A452HVH5_9SAUR
MAAAAALPSAPWAASLASLAPVATALLPGDCAGVCLTVCLLLTAEISYPKPSISLRPSRGVALGGAMTVRCQGQHQNMRFLLYKDRNPTALQYADPSGNVAEFPICNMNQRDAGSYRLCLVTPTYLFLWSHPSDPVELVVSRPWSYPKPSISVSPGGVIPIGGNVTIQCWHQRLGMRILPCKAGDGNYLTYTDPAGSEAEFPITSARREHGGSYTCRCSNRSVQAGYSEPSYPVQIIVAGEGPSPALRLPAPHPDKSLGTRTDGQLRASVSLIVAGLEAGSRHPRVTPELWAVVRCLLCS